MSNNWKSRIVGHAEVDPRSLTGHPINFRTHPMAQRAVIRDSIAEFGFVKSVLVNQSTGFIVDGHARVHEAYDEIERLEKAGKPTDHVLVPVEYVELSESEEAAVLAVLDASSEMAIVDPVKLDELLREVNTGSESISKMLNDLAEETGVIDQSLQAASEGTECIAVASSFNLVVECDDNDQLKELVNRLENEGFKCRLSNL